MHPRQPNAAQKRWRENVRSLALGTIIHHATDRTMQIKGIGNIGHWWLIPVFSQGEHSAIHALGHARKEFEKNRFKIVCEDYKAMIGPLPLPPGVYDAIMEFHR